MILEKIHDPADIRSLNDKELPVLCDELRQFLVEKVSQSGGHLASNLGVVELTVAIHRVFDTARDRLIFDVGHQCYVHKALTGRQSDFASLRQFDGLSGFPKPWESEHDAFVAGHASNSVSVALGMARARTLQRQDYHVLALIGDGALGGGLSFEGLNDAGASGEPMIVILNDNGMSIRKNVGGMSGYLAKLRVSPRYIDFKKWYRRTLGRTQGGRRFYEWSHKAKQAVKKSLIPGSSVFENMGFTYLGPLDGHDLDVLTQTLEFAKTLQRPVLVHVNTVKGKGYPFAEAEPGRFHGIGAFDPATGQEKKRAGVNFSQVFGQELTAMAAEDPKICAITAAMADVTGLSAFASALPKRFFDVGIAEGHAVAMAAGMAKQGMTPVFAVYSTFLQRGYDMLLHDVSLSHLHVVLAVDRAGLVGADGETHHGCFDVPYLTQIPGMTVYAPSDFAELRAMLHWAVEDTDGPAAIRYPRGGEGVYTACCDRTPLSVLRRGEDAAILTYGIMVNEALRAADLLAEKGYSVGVIKLNRIAPLEEEALCAAVSHVGCLLVLEDCVCAGCMGERIAAILTQHQAAPQKLLMKNIGRTIPTQGSVPQLYHALGIDADSVAAALEEELEHGR